MEFIVELLMEFLFGGVAIELLGERNIKSAWKSHPIRLVFVILSLMALLVLAFFGAVWMINLISLFSFRSSEKILFLGRGGDILISIIFVMLIIFEVLIEITILFGIMGLILKITNKRNKTKREKLTKKEKKVSAIFISVLAAVFVLISYCYTFNATVFTEKRIIKYSFFNPKGTEYKYSDIDCVEINADSANIRLLLKTNNKTINFNSEADAYSDIEKYKNNDFLFIADTIERFRNQGTKIVYNCTYNDIAQYVDENYYKTELSRIFK